MESDKQLELAVWRDDNQRQSILQEAAIVWNLDPERVNEPKVLTAINRAIRLCARYGLEPGQDVFLIPFKDKKGESDNFDKPSQTEETNYSVVESLSAWEKYANREAYRNKFHWQAQYRRVDDKSIAALRQHLQDDVVRRYGKVLQVEAWECRIVRLDVAHEYRNLGIPYDPEWHVGYVFLTERKGKNNSTYTVWDTPIPRARTPESKAKQRALRHALARNFTQVEPQERVSIQQTLALLQDRAAAIREEQETPEDPAMLIEFDQVTEDSDGMLWAAEPHQSSQPQVPDETPGDYRDFRAKESHKDLPDNSQDPVENLLKDPPALYEELSRQFVTAQTGGKNITMSGLLFDWAKTLPWSKGEFNRFWANWNQEYGKWADIETADRPTWEIEFIAHVLEATDGTNR